VPKNSHLLFEWPQRRDDGTLFLHRECFTDLGKLNFPMRFGFRLKPIFNTAPAASKNNTQFKSGQI